MKLQFFYMLFNFSAFKEVFLNWRVFFLVTWEAVKVVHDQKIELNNDI